MTEVASKHGSNSTFETDVKMVSRSLCQENYSVTSGFPTFAVNFKLENVVPQYFNSNSRKCQMALLGVTLSNARRFYSSIGSAIRSERVNNIIYYVTNDKLFSLRNWCSFVGGKDNNRSCYQTG